MGNILTRLGNLGTNTTPNQPVQKKKFLKINRPTDQRILGSTRRISQTSNKQNPSENSSIQNSSTNSFREHQQKRQQQPKQQQLQLQLQQSELSETSDVPSTKTYLKPISLEEANKLYTKIEVRLDDQELENQKNMKKQYEQELRNLQDSITEMMNKQQMLLNRKNELALEQQNYQVQYKKIMSVRQKYVEIFLHLRAKFENLLPLLEMKTERDTANLGNSKFPISGQLRTAVYNDLIKIRPRALLSEAFEFTRDDDEPSEPSRLRGYGHILRQAQKQGDTEMTEFVAWSLLRRHLDQGTGSQSGDASGSDSFYRTKIMNEYIKKSDESLYEYKYTEEFLLPIIYVFIVRLLAAKGHDLPYKALIGCLLYHFPILLQDGEGTQREGANVQQQQGQPQTDENDDTETLLRFVTQENGSKYNANFRKMEFYSLNLWLAVLLDIRYFYRRFLGYPIKQAYTNNSTRQQSFKCWCGLELEPMALFLCPQHSQSKYLERNDQLTLLLLKPLAKARPSALTAVLGIYLFEFAVVLYYEISDNFEPNLNNFPYIPTGNVLNEIQELKKHYTSVVKRESTKELLQCILQIVYKHFSNRDAVFSKYSALTKIRNASLDQKNECILAEAHKNYCLELPKCIFNKSQILPCVNRQQKDRRAQQMQRINLSDKSQSVNFRNLYETPNLLSGLVTALSPLKNGCSCTDCSDGFCACLQRNFANCRNCGKNNGACGCADYTPCNWLCSCHCPSREQVNTIKQEFLFILNIIRDNLIPI